MAIITGGAQGIGAATARAIVREGAAVVIADTNCVGAERIVEEIRGQGRQALSTCTDVTNRDSLESMAETAISRFGRIDVLIASAGVNVFSDPLQLTEEQWQECLAVDLNGVWYSIRVVLPQMLLQQTGSIVVMASCHSFQIIPNCFPYPIAKHGVIGLVKALGVQYADNGIRVNAIAPGYIATELAEKYWKTFPDPEAERRRICSLHPQRRIGTAEEVAMTAVFLASEEATFINATVIQMDGGRSALYHD